MPRQRKNMPYAWPTWRQGKVEWHIVDIESYVKEGFNANSLIYAAIMYKVKAMIPAPLRAYQGDRDKPEPLDEGHPLAKLLARPNIHQSGEEFKNLNRVYWNLSGNCYILIDKGVNDEYPKAMYPLRPDRVWIIPKPKKAGERPGMIGYLYVPEGKEQREGLAILPEHMMHVKLPNPWDSLEGMGYGLSPISPLARSADVDNMATKFLQHFFQRGAMPLGLLSFEDAIDPDTGAEIAERFKEMHGGYDQWDKVFILDHGGEYQRITPTFEEMSFHNIDQRNESRILGPLGVPPILVGARIGLENSPWSNIGEARRICWEDAILPENRLFEVEYQYFLAGEGDEFVQYDYSKVPALQKDIAKLAEAAFQLWQMGVQANVALDKVGLEIEKLPAGDIAYIPFNMMQVGEERPALPAGQPVAADEESKERGFTEEQKERLLNTVDRIAQSWEDRFGQKAESQFEHDKRKLLALLTKAKKKSVEEKATVDWQGVYADWMTYLDAAGEGWRIAFLPLIKGVITEQAVELGVAFGAAFEVSNLWAEAWFDTYTMEFAEAVVEATGTAISSMLKTAMARGWSIPTMSKRLELMFKQWMKGDLSDEDFKWFEKRMPAYRREMIARTETIRASNKGTEALFKQWGVQWKEWLTALDERTCPWCVRMNGKRLVTGGTWHQKGTQWNVQVEVDGEKKMRTLKFDYEDIKGPPLHPNCRCTLIPWKEEWATL